MRHVARIDQAGFERAPSLFGHFEFRAVETVIEQAALAAAKMNVEVIGLQAVRHRSDLAESSVFEFEQRHRSRVVFIKSEDLATAAITVTLDLLDFGIHEHQQKIESVTAGGQKAAAAEILLDIQAELAVPRSDAVIIINLGVMK